MSLPIQLGKPQWWPLEQFVIREWKGRSVPLTPFHVATFCSQFMFMGESESLGETYSLYKHSLSRRYLILDKATIIPHHFREGVYMAISPREAIAYVNEYLEPDQQVWARTF